MPRPRRYSSWKRLFLLVVGIVGAVWPDAVVAQSADLERLLQRADESYRRGNYNRAAGLLDSAIESRPRDLTPGVYAKRASIFLIEKHFAAGVEWIEGTAEKYFPGDPQIEAQKALLLSRLPSRQVDAVLLAEKVLAIRPNEYPLQLLVGDFYVRKNRSAAKAVVAYRSFLANRSDKRVRTKLGFALLLAGEPEQQDRTLQRTVGDQRIRQPPETTRP